MIRNDPHINQVEELYLVSNLLQQTLSHKALVSEIPAYLSVCVRVCIRSLFSHFLSIYIKLHHLPNVSLSAVFEFSLVPCLAVTDH